MRAPLPHRSRTGYVLMEVMLAAAIFAMAGVGLAIALNELSQTFIRARVTVAVRLELESRLTDARIHPLAPTREEDKPDDQGISYTKEVAPLQLVNKDNLPLPNLYRVTLTAHWKEGRVDQEEMAEIYVYQP